MREVSARAVLAGAFIQLLLASGPTLAQTNIETNAPGVQLNFSTPGARSLAMGGTFLGRADDATAAYANPAGLANLPQPEASLELRAWDFTHVFTDRGRSGNAITNFGTDTIKGLVDGTASDQVSGVSFGSYVYPKRRWAVAVYFHRLADFEANFETQGAYVGEPDFEPGLFYDTSRLNPITSASRLQISNSGVSASYRLTEHVSVGIGLSRYDFLIDSTLVRFDLKNDDDPFFPLFGEKDESKVLAAQTQKGTDSDLGATIGLLWRIAPRWQLGAVYRQGPSFAFCAKSSQGARGEKATFNVPDIWGVGVTWQTTDRLIVGVDFYRVGYSAFARDFTDVLGIGAEDYGAEDGSEFHAGLEYSFPNGARPWFLRSGLWWDPEHGVRYVGDPESGLGKVEAARFRPRDGALHWALGGGVVGNSYQIDAGVDYSERTVTVAVSTVVRF